MVGRAREVQPFWRFEVAPLQLGHHEEPSASRLRYLRTQKIHIHPVGTADIRSPNIPTYYVQ